MGFVFVFSKRKQNHILTWDKIKTPLYLSLITIKVRQCKIKADFVAFLLPPGTFLGRFKSINQLYRFYRL